MLPSRLQGLADWFQSLEQRERRLIGFALCVLLPAVLLFAWVEPMLASRQALHERLERLERERARMQALAQEWRSLDQQLPQAKRQDLEARILASLKARADLDGFSVKVLDQGSILLEAAAVPRMPFMAWLVEVRRETQTQWSEFRIERAPQSEYLKIRIRFVEAAAST
jgi:type II secretory pathway component PulM